MKDKKKKQRKERVLEKQKNKYYLNTPPDGRTKSHFNFRPLLFFPSPTIANDTVSSILVFHSFVSFVLLLF
jgi:hypothetical protein